MKIDSEEKQPHLNGKIYENEFGYHTNSEVYANKGSDITELYEIARISRENIKRLCAYIKYVE